MECKVRFSFFILCHYYRFNRYIVECKVEIYLFCVDFAMRFNRYIVECKAYGIERGLTGSDDLIDTLWNVKKTPAELLNVVNRI